MSGLKQPHGNTSGGGSSSSRSSSTMPPPLIAAAPAPVPAPAPDKKPLINLLRGWPAPSMLPAHLLRGASDRVLSRADVFVPALQYGPSPGYQPLREALAAWLGGIYGSSSSSSPSTPTTAKPDSAATAGSTTTVTATSHAAAPDPNSICITGGASQGLACILQSFTDPARTRAVWLVAPCYFLACPIFEDAGFRGRLRAVREDDGGIDLDALEEGIGRVEREWEEEGRGDRPAYKTPGPHRKIYRHVIYAVPTAANPSGRTMTLARRQGLVRLARRWDALVVCDDVYDLLQWAVLDYGRALPDDHLTRSPSAISSAAAGRPAVSPDPIPLPAGAPLPRLSDMDLAMGPSPHDPPGGGRRFGHAISNGSFSKLLAPGCRTGWVHAAPDFAFGLGLTGSTQSGGAPSQLVAAMVCELLTTKTTGLKEEGGSAGAAAAGTTSLLDHHIASSLRPALQRRHALLVAAVEKELGWAGVRIEEGGGDGRGGRRFGGYNNNHIAAAAASSTSTTPSAQAGHDTNGTHSTTTNTTAAAAIYGGYFIWLTLPAELGVGAAALAERARAEEQLVIAPGRLFEVSMDEGAARFERNVRLCYAWAEEEELVEGVRRLGRVLRRMVEGVEDGGRGGGEERMAVDDVK